jgi:hypothetical protein
VRVSRKNTTAGSSRTSEHGLSERRTSVQEIEVNTIKVGEINGVVGEEVVMEDMDYTKLKNKVTKPKKRVAGETGPELSSDEELRAQFSTARNSKKPKKSTNDGVKQGTNKIQNINKSLNHNQAKEIIEQGLIQQVESEAQSLGNEVTNKSGNRYDQTSQNGRVDLGERFKSKEEKIMIYVLKSTKKGHSTST